jgi:hypothetical protein
MSKRIELDLSFDSLPLEELVGCDAFITKFATFDPAKCKSMIQIATEAEPLDTLPAIEDQTTIELRNLAITFKTVLTG